MDTQSVKNTDTAKGKGYDGGKKVLRIKSHIIVDTQGLPHANYVTTANVNDREGALSMFKDAKGNLSEVINVLVDSDYTGWEFANEVENILGASVEVAKRNELCKFSVIPKRYVVETHWSWMQKCCSL